MDTYYVIKQKKKELLIKCTLVILYRVQLLAVVFDCIVIV